MCLEQLEAVLGVDVAADLEAMAAGWAPAARQRLRDRALGLAGAGMPPAAALLVAVGVLVGD